MDVESRDRRLEAATAEARTAFTAALRNGDAKAASRVYAAGAKLLAPSSATMEGREAIEAFWQTGVEAGVSEVELEVLELECRTGLAYEIGRYALHLHADGSTVVDRGKYLLVLAQQEDGTWRRAVEMFNPDSTDSR
jgi:ketosteroid isomerase-like protein